MIDFNLGKLIYEFSNALIEEDWVESNYPISFKSEARTYRLMYSIRGEYLKGYRSKTIDSYTARSMGLSFDKDYFKFIANEKGLYYRKFKVWTSTETLNLPTNTVRQYKNQYLVKIADKHFVKFSKTNVIYHYFGSNNRTKMSDRQRTKESYKRRFYKRKLQYGTFFYDLPKRFDIRKDWNKVLFSYLNHINL